MEVAKKTPMNVIKVVIAAVYGVIWKRAIAVSNGQHYTNKMRPNINTFRFIILSFYA